jgi:hypothetical protein
MSESGFASLGPTLLARKGGAKPAMRPQIAPLVKDEAELAALADEQLEDLGWNDMGENEPHGSADIVPINADLAAEDFAQGPGPIVRRQQRRLEERVLADAAMTGPEDCEPEYDAEDENFYGEDYAAAPEYVAQVSQPEPVAPRSRPAAPVAATASSRRAAFTLRLDADRHLKLRLAATMRGQSAQTLVTEALDRLLAEFDELDVIANHLKRH